MFNQEISILSAYLAEVMQDENSYAQAEAYYSETLRSECFSLQSVTNLEYLADIKEELSRGDSSVDFPPQTLVCELCNYKGEGEGLALYNDVKHLAIYRAR